MVEDEVMAVLTRESCLQMFMNCMPSKYRAVYTLRIMLQFSVAETSEILEISESAVKGAPVVMVLPWFQYTGCRMNRIIRIPRQSSGQD